MRKKHFIIYFILLTTFSFNLQAQYSVVDNTFNTGGSGANINVKLSVVQSDGKILIYGDNLTSYNGTTKGKLFRLNADGSLDTSFNPGGTGPDSFVSSIFLQTDGKIIICGYFMSYNGTMVNGQMARLNADGTLDNTFNTPLYAAIPSTSATQADGKILVGGTVSMPTPTGLLTRLNTNLSKDANFNPGGSGPDNDVKEIVIQSDGKIIIRGTFQNYNGTARSHIARVNSNGTLDTGFDLSLLNNPSYKNTVSKVIVQSDGKIILVGTANMQYLIGSVYLNGIVRLNTDGSLDASFAGGTGINTGGYIQTIALLSDGKMMIGGEFTSYNGITRNRIARLNADGSLDTSFDPALSANSTINTISVQSTNRVIIGGNFTSYNGTVKNYLTRLKSYFTWTGAFNNAWANANNWNPAFVPSTYDQAFIPKVSTYPTVTTAVTVDNITVAPAAQLTLSTGGSVNVTNLNLQSSSDIGPATVLDNGLPLTATSVNVQYSSSLANRNWYVSTPVTGATSGAVTNVSGNKLYKYDENLFDFPQITGPTTPFDIMKGYVAYVAKGSSINFTGTGLNTGNKSFTINRTENGKIKRGYDLMGNPYPSYVNIEMATKTNLTSTMWVRTRNALNNAYIFDTYNELTKVGTSVNGVELTKFIPPMQGFWVRVSAGKTSGTLAFTNAMRSHGVSTNKLKAPAQQLQQVLRVQVSNGVNTDEAILVFNPKASDEFDDYDSEKMTNDNFAIPEIYTMVGNEQLVINGMNAIIPNKEYPLGFNAGEFNSYSIKASEIGNFDSGLRIILKDKLLNKEQDLTEGTAYSFTSDKVNTISRFSLIFKTNSIASGIQENRYDTNSILITQNASRQLTVKYMKDFVGQGTVSIVNGVGQCLAYKSMKNAITIFENNLNSGVYFVNVNVNGKKSTSKVIVF